jgi:nucleoside-diphosphate-sugar epimerase
MKYIITGGLGFIGSHLYAKLKEVKQNKVLLIDNLYSGTIDNIKNLDNNDFINMDIRDNKIINYFEENDIVIHLAAISSLPECQSNPVLCYDVNVNGTLNILEICRKKNIAKIIFASTSAVYENNNNFPIKETDEVSPTLIYSMSKYSCEKLCNSYIKNYNLNINIIRFFNVYGGNQDFRRTSPPLTSYIINCILTKQDIILHSDGNQSRDYIYIKDLLDMIFKVINYKKNGKIFNACSGNLISVNKIFDLISNNLKSNVKPKYAHPSNFWNKYNNIIDGNNPLNKDIIIKEVNKHTYGDNTYSKIELDWKINFDYEKGIEHMIKSYLFHHT